jgi:hypothetical protein
VTDWYNEYAWFVFPVWLLATGYAVYVALRLSAKPGPCLMRLAGFIVAMYCLLRALTCLLRAMEQFALAREVCDATTLWSLLGAVGVAVYMHRWRPGCLGRQ